MKPIPGLIRLRTAPGVRTEELRRRVYLGVAALACLSQLTVTGLDIFQGGGFQNGLHWQALHGEPVFGALLCGSLIPLLLRRTIPVQWIDFGVLGVASAAVAFALVAAFQSPDVPQARLYFVGVFLFLAAFSILPASLAALYSAALYFIVVALTLLKGGDTTLLLEMALIVLLIAHLSVFGQRVSAERRETQVFQKLAETDALTGLTNRRAMYWQLERVLTSKANANSAALLLDIDHFKQVNDQHGHLTGDQVLQCFASALQGAVGPDDVVSRWGGEEFLILLSNVNQAGALAAAQRLLDAVRRCAMPAGLHITASCGVAHAREVTSAAAWLSQVDLRLYAAKHAGRDRVMPQA
ncbi:hypothetical protein GCM10022631_06430 [Deinococcus rubellus]|uniref:GGDEF domain-containing protein n=1 Tax=Deinococcus rubellus TaxID=1889240 RepID=A0ABY5YIR0_9DEIO|nr:GGDEF domain-containing protein [Deinococcus rubellus]UWX64011.1 GGDEF domain-containing protein [Deinococcus rubellus]